MASFDIQGRVGRQSLSAGAQAIARQALDGSLVFTPGSGAYYQLVKDGGVYIAQTAVTGVAPGTSVGTTAAAALANPVGSGKDLVLIRATMGYVSGTLGAGVVSYCAGAYSATAVSGTAMLTRNALLGGAVGAIGQPFTTATLPAAPTPIATFCSLGASLASTAVQPWQIVDEVAGSIMIGPGTSLSLQATAAGGSSPLVVFSFTWAEIPA